MGSALCIVHPIPITRPAAAGPACPAEQYQHLNLRNDRMSRQAAGIVGRPFEIHYESTGGNADNTGKSSRRAEERAIPFAAVVA
jgi:hypothetical protein